MVKVKKILAICLTVASLGFGVAGFVVPPTGVISSSVLWFCAQCFLFAATLLGIDLEYIKYFKK